MIIKCLRNTKIWEAFKTFEYTNTYKAWYLQKLWGDFNIGKKFRNWRREHNT